MPPFLDYPSIYPPVRFRVFSSIKVPLQEWWFLWHILTSLQQQVDILVGWGIYPLYISPHWTPNQLRIWNLKLCPHLMIAVLRDEFPHSQVCQLSDQVIALSIVHWEHPRLCSVGMGCWFQEVCWKKFIAYLVETLTVSWSRPAFFWMSVTSVHLTITFIVEMRNENGRGLQTY